MVGASTASGKDRLTDGLHPSVSSIASLTMLISPHQKHRETGTPAQRQIAVEASGAGYKEMPAAESHPKIPLTGSFPILLSLSSRYGETGTSYSVEL